jgi:hypothetical protein
LNIFISSFSRLSAAAASSCSSFSLKRPYLFIRFAADGIDATSPGNGPWKSQTSPFSGARNTCRQRRIRRGVNTCSCVIPATGTDCEQVLCTSYMHRRRFPSRTCDDPGYHLGGQIFDLNFCIGFTLRRI